VDAFIPPPPISVASIPWNATGNDLGAVSALAEQGETLVLFGARGVQVLAGGAVAATDPAVTMWRTAAVVAAGDGSAAQWVIGVDGMGRVLRLRDGTRMEDVTGRYALAMRDVRSVGTLARNRTAFGFTGGLAVADGMRVTVWMEPSFADLVASGNRVAARTMTGLRVFDIDATRLVDFTLAGVTGVAFDARGRLVVTAGEGLYAENDMGELVLRVTMSALRGVVQSGARTWLVAGPMLATWDGTDVRLSTNVMVPAGARLHASPSGDVWVFGTGAPARFGVVESPDLQRWIETVRPVFARRCTPCHLPGGVGNLDLPTYDAWVRSRALIREQAITRRAMPPPPGMLTTEERDALAAWLDARPTDGGTPDVPADRAVDAPRDAGVDVPMAMDVPRDVPTPMDVPRDVRADTGPDVRMDVATDVRPDVRADAGADAGADVRTDTGADVRTDTGADVRTDAGADVRTDTGADVRTDAGADVRTDAGVVTYAAVDTIFQASCVRCHGTSGGLNLSDPTAAYTALVGRAAAGAMCTGGGRVRVVAGDPMASLLYLKLVGMQDCGGAMPRGAAMLPAAQIDTVRRWIAGGARR
jgi:mono/diheme cytochrome c family protein